MRNEVENESVCSDYNLADTPSGGNTEWKEPGPAL